VALEKEGEYPLEGSNEKLSGFTLSWRKGTSHIQYKEGRLTGWDTMRWNYLLKQSIQGKIGETERRGRRRKQLLNDLQKTQRYSFLKEKVLDCNICTSRFVRGYGTLARRTT
jgi:hypothetical protein